MYHGSFDAYRRANPPQSTALVAPPRRPFVFPVEPLGGALWGWLIAAISGRSKKGESGYVAYRAKRKKFVLTGVAVGVVGMIYNGVVLTTHRNRVREYESTTGSAVPPWWLAS